MLDSFDNRHMQRATVSSLARHGIILIEGILVAAIAWFSLAFFDVLLSSGAAGPSWSDLAGVYLVYLMAPLLVVLSSLSVLKWQWRSSGPSYGPFVLLLAANASLAHSWGMHSYPAQSVAFSLGALALSSASVFGSLRLQRRLRETASREAGSS